MRVTKQAMVALKNAYGGALMFIIIGSLVGVQLGPIGLGIGLVMGHRGLREEKKRQVQRRRAEARNAIRRYCDEVIFVASKDSRDTLRRVQRQLRDHYSGAGRGAQPVQRPGAGQRLRGGETDPGRSGEAAQGRRIRAGPGAPTPAACPGGDRMNLIDRTRAALAQAIDVYRGTEYHGRLTALRDRLDEPLRVAVAGRVKAGKSTLLNALVGERLAPTDAGECTRVVTWYQDGHTLPGDGHAEGRCAAPAPVHP